MNKSIIEAVSENISISSFPSTTKVFNFFLVNMSHTELAPDLKLHVTPFFCFYPLWNLKTTKLANDLAF